MVLATPGAAQAQLREHGPCKSLAYNERPNDATAAGLAGANNQGAHDEVFMGNGIWTCFGSGRELASLSTHPTQPNDFKESDHRVPPGQVFVSLKA